MFGMLAGVGGVPVSSMRVVARFFVASGLVMFGRFRVVAGCVCMVFRCLPMMIRRSFRHSSFPLLCSSAQERR
jgi:hypothetical protein